MFRLIQPVLLACLFILALQATTNQSLHAAAPQETLENIASGKPCEFSRPPNYKLCQDRSDRSQLTDGKFTKGHFWTQSSTVGWQSGQSVLLTIDLEKSEPIRGVSFSTAAGVAGVHWPESIALMVSDDGKQWYPCGDLVALSNKNETPPAEGYGTHVFRTDELKAFGRFLGLGIEPHENFIFVDEIEIFRGDETFRDVDRGHALGDSMAIVQASKVAKFLRSQLQADLDVVQANINSAATPQASKAKLLQQASDLGVQVKNLTTNPRVGFKAILPMNDLEQEIFSLQSETWRSQNRPAMRTWKTHRWDMLKPMDEPSESSPIESTRLHIDLLNGEHRADVLNVTSAESGDVELQVSVEGLPKGSNPDYMSVHEVLCVGTRHLGAISSPLPKMKRKDGKYTMTIAAGMTRQIWFDFHPVDLPPGRHVGHVSLRYGTDKEQRVPIELVVWPERFPKKAGLMTGGWSYTNAKADRGVTESNRQELIEFLQQFRVNSPWATRRSMPDGKYSETGELIENPDTTNFDSWVKEWPDAERYMVFLAVGGYSSVFRPTFAGAKPGTKLFEKQLSAWTHFWANHMRELGLKPSQLGLCIFDEPVEKEQFDLVLKWNQVVTKSEPEILTMVDPVFRSQDGSYLQMMADMKEVVPNRRLWKKYIDWYPEVFELQRREGRQLGFYSCAGPARSFDPYSYYLLQAWHTFKIGGTYSGFWSFGDDRGADCWNDFSGSGKGSYCPQYLDQSEVVSDKRMVAIREGSQDFEYLVMLRDRIKSLEASGKTSPALTRARDVLDAACNRVLVGFEETNFRWDQTADREEVDRVRVEILQALSSLKNP